MKKKPSFVKRELARILGSDPEGDRIPYEITRWLLAIVAMGTFLTAVAVAPGAARGIYWLVGAIKKSTDPHARRIAKYRNLKRLVLRIHQQGFIRVAKRHRKEVVVITDRGLARLMSYTIDDLAIPKPERWDGVWRMVAFDIPETRKQARDILREKLRNLGFLQLQKSLFVYPYPCRAEIDYLIEVFNIRPHVTFIETKSLGRQEPSARSHFGLL